MNSRFWAVGVSVVFLGLSGCLKGGSGSSSSNNGGAVGGSSASSSGEGTLVNNPLSSICRTLGGDLYVGSNGGKQLVSTDGVNFSDLSETDMDVASVACDQQSTTVTKVWFVGAGGGIAYYNGSELSLQDSGTTQNLHDVFRGYTYTFIVGDYGTIRRTDGTTWSAQTIPTAVQTKDLRGVSGALGSETHFTVGADRTVLQTIDSGNNWTAVTTLPVSVPAGTRLNDVWVNASPQEVFVAGDAGTLIRRDSVMLTWIKQDLGDVTADLLAVHGMLSPSTMVIAVGKQGTILRYTGTDWAPVSNPAEADGYWLTDVLVVSDTEAYAVGAASDAPDAEGIILKWDGDIWNRLL